MAQLLDWPELEQDQMSRDELRQLVITIRDELVSSDDALDAMVWLGEVLRIDYRDD